MVENDHKWEDAMNLGLLWIALTVLILVVWGLRVLIEKLFDVRFDQLFETFCEVILQRVFLAFGILFLSSMVLFVLAGITEFIFGVHFFRWEE